VNIFIFVGLLYRLSEVDSLWSRRLHAWYPAV